MNRELRPSNTNTHELITGVPDFSDSYSPPADLPTKENPEIFDQESVSLFPIPRTAGGTTGMYQYGRFFDKSGREILIFRGAVQEDIRGTVGYPEKHIPREAFERMRAERQRRIDTEMGKRALPAVVGQPEHTSSSDQERGEAKDERLALLYSPILRPELPPEAIEDQYNYDHMFADDDTAAAEQERRRQIDEHNKPILDEQRRYDARIDEDTKRNAADYLERAEATDPELKRIIESIIGQVPARQVVDALREKSDVRYQVAMYLLEKLNRVVDNNPSRWPERIVRNSMKSSDVVKLPIDPCTSREYAVYLALAHIDGSYNGLLGTDRIERDESGKVIRGQHRSAAMMLLNSKDIKSDT